MVVSKDTGELFSKSVCTVSSNDLESAKEVLTKLVVAFPKRERYNILVMSVDEENTKTLMTVMDLLKLEK